MTRRILFLLLAIALTPFVRAAGARSALKWTPAQRQALLDKAEHGDRSSQMWLGCAYEQGWFGETNFPEALKWFRKAAAQGDPDAQFSLGRMYADGEGVAQNYKLAAGWYRMAAEHVPDYGGAGQGRNALGLLYLDGRGVPKSYVQAYMWFRLAKDDEAAADARSHMSSAEIAGAERLIADWQRRHATP
ncbi:MAG TPA: tetratricopeptide repeat protein [Candidatus Aquilonibacter sp.]|nr:tetratricopeptide repeat protein [Candidatus Aquilonibacter sp.]